jgi:glycogen(starch) synthase
MRVLMTADAVGGVWTYALELVDALAPHGVEVDLATMGPRPSDDQRAEAAASVLSALHESELALEWMDDPWEDVERAGAWLLELRDAVRPDVVHLNGYAHAALPWDVPVVVVAHSDVLSWFRAVKGESAPRSWTRYRRAVERGLAAADVVVAPTAVVLAELVDLYRTDFRGLVIPNGRSASPQPTAADKEPFVLACGRLWDEAKNVAALDRVAADIEWPVFVSGDAGGAWHPNVRALGRLPVHELAALMRRASIFALPARYEPFGLAALEAAQAGCALVLGDIPSLREVWGDAALFVSPDDDAGLAATLQRLIDDEPLRREQAGRALEQAGLYTPERMAAGYLEAYALVRRVEAAA